MSCRKSICGRIRISSAAALISLGFAAQALAHANLISAAPAANSMAMPPPAELRLKFSEGVEVQYAKVEVTGPGKKAIKSGALKLDGRDNTVLIVPLMEPLADGKYTVDWQVVSVDGHRTQGSYGFESMK